MRLRDLRWHILAAVILLCSYAALVVGFYLPIRAKAITSLQTVTEEIVQQDVSVVSDTINSYYKRFSIGDFTNIHTEFDKTGYASLMDGKSILIAESSHILKNNDASLAVFFYNSEVSSDEYCGGYIYLEDILSNFDQKFIVFNSSNGIKYNQITEQNYGTMNLLLNDDSFASHFSENFKVGEPYSKIYTVEKEEGVLAVVSYLDYYIGVFYPLNTIIFSVQWALTQAITFFIVGVVIIALILVIIILGCRKAAVILRVDRHSVENAHSLIIRVKKDGTIIFTNLAFKKLCNLKKLPDLNDFKEVHSKEPIFKYFKEKKTIQCFYESEAGTKYFQFTPIGVVSTFYLVGSDITEEFIRIQELEALNGKNEYTGCDNNFALSNLYPSIMAQANSDLAFVEFSIYKYLDIISLFGNDNFQILLNELLSILKVQFEGNSIYQIRDERFMIIVPNQNVKDVVELCNKTILLLKKPVLVRRNNIYVNLKCVICNLIQEEQEGVTLQEVKRRIELAYHTIVGFAEKDVALYDSAMEGVISARMQLEEDLKLAIEQQQFLQYLQPQFDLHKNKIVGFESLIRWNDPKYMDKSPQEFIELAEHKGYILDISKFVINNTFALAKRLEKYDITISMNLSPIQIIQVGFVNELKSKFDEYQLKPGSIALEITETFLMENFSLVNEKLKVLKKEGFQIHLDDFGTGYSSMVYLKDLPVDAIKIDYQFTKYVDTNKVNYSIVSCISTLAKELGLDVIVEGVETKSQQDVVKKLGCRIIQGFSIGKAMPIEEAEKMLNKMNEK